MKTGKKALVFTLALSTLAMVGAASASTASACGFGFGFGGNSQNRDSLIQKLVDRFNLNKDDVTSVFNDQENEVRQQRKSQLEDRLNQAVKDGKITEDQKNALLGKIDEWQQQREEISKLSGEDRTNKIKEYQDQMQQWLKDNNIDLKSLRVGMGWGGFGRGFHGRLNK